MKGTSSAFLMRSLGALFLFLFNLLIARLLGPGPAGTYYLALTVATIISSISVLGIDQVLLKRVSGFKAKNDYDNIASFYTHGVRVVIFFSVIATILCLLVSKPIALKLFNNPELITPLRIMSLMIIPLSLSTIFGELLRSFKKVWQSVLIITTLTPLVGIAIVLLGSSFFEDNATNISLYHLIAATITALTGYVIWKKGLPKKAKIQDVKKSFLVMAGFPIMFIILGQAIMGWLDTFMLGIYESPEAVGVYGVALRVSKLLSFVLYGVVVISGPKFAALYAANKSRELERLARQSTTLAAVLSLPIILFMAIFSAQILGIFGPAFVAGQTALIILICGQVINTLTGPIGALLVMTGQEKSLRNLILVTMIISILLYAYLIPRYGINGAALGTSIGMAIEMVGSVLISRKKLGIVTLPTVSWRKK